MTVMSEGLLLNSKYIQMVREEGGFFSCSGMFRHVPGFIDAAVEPRYSEGPRDWQNMFVITRFFFLNLH